MVLYRLTWHLVLVYMLMLFLHVYSPMAGADNPLGTNVDVNGKPLSLCPFVASFKTISSKSDFIHIFNDFIHAYSPGARAYNPLGTNFWCQQKALITLPICCKFKKRNLILYTFLMILYMYIATGQGQTTPSGQTFDVNRKPYHFAHLLQVSKRSLRNLILYTFLMILYMHIAPGQGHTTPSGQTFDVSRKPLSLCPFVAGLKKIALKSDFIYIFSCFTICL